MAEYWTLPEVEGKTTTIRKSKSGSPPVCLTCVKLDCKHVTWFKKQLKDAPEPWEVDTLLETPL